MIEPIAHTAAIAFSESDRTKRLAALASLRHATVGHRVVLFNQKRRKLEPFCGEYLIGTVSDITKEGYLLNLDRARVRPSFRTPIQGDLIRVVANAPLPLDLHAWKEFQLRYAVPETLRFDLELQRDTLKYLRHDTELHAGAWIEHPAIPVHTVVPLGFFSSLGPDPFSVAVQQARFGANYIRIGAIRRA